MRHHPPAPTGATNLQAWAQQVYTYLLDQQFGRKEIVASPVFLSHMTGQEKATTDGILMYDPVDKQVVVSVDGAWKPIAWVE